VRRRLDRDTLAALRAMRSDDVLELIAIYLKDDSTYCPMKDLTSRRWHGCTSRGDFEIITTGTKWYDTRAKKGGGGAIDLVMHLEDLSFRESVARLRSRTKRDG
jgi:hypothetical protein